MAHVQLDARQLLCPIPVLKTQQMVRKLNQGDVLEIICTDATTIQDIPAWCRIHGHELIEIKQQNSEIHFFLRVK